MRTGFGYDIHRFAPHRKLILGGAEIDYPVGLLGHSDADVLLHSICDALLGAAGLRDIGFFFPDTDEKWRGISSLLLLKETGKLLKKKKYKIINIDSTLILEEPKISQYIGKMKKNIATTLKLKESQISIKATTSEGLGFIGNKEGCAAITICSIKK